MALVDVYSSEELFVAYGSNYKPSKHYVKRTLRARVNSERHFLFTGTCFLSIKKMSS